MENTKVSKDVYIITVVLMTLPVLGYSTGMLIHDGLCLVLAEIICLCLGYVIFQHRQLKLVKQQQADVLAQQEEERHAQEKIINELTENLSIIEATGYGIWRIYLNPDGINKMVVDDKIQGMLGIKGMNLTPEEIYEFYHARLEKFDEIEADDYQMMLQGKIMGRLLTYNHPTKGKVNFQAGGTLHMGQGGVSYISGYCGDVTDRVQREARIESKLNIALENEKKANAAKTAFLASMSHDIRTPLNCIIGLLELNSNHPEDRQMVDENREKARVAAKHLLDLVNDVLEITKIDVDEVTLSNEVFSIRTLVADVETIVRERALERGIRFVSENEISDISDAIYLYGSPVHLRQLFLNVFSNAVKYNREGGMVSIKKELVSQNKKDVTYKFIISDTGIGMSQEFLNHIFEPFTQEHESARSTYSGTGLGMYITKRLVEMMHGSISVASKEGLGTSVEITLPFKIAREEDLPEKLDLSKVDITGIKILVVEDNEINAEIIRRLLVDFGAQVTMAANGKEGVEKFVDNPPGTYDVILMDLMMPVMDGYAATKSIRSFNREDARTIPIYAMTANAFADDVKRCLETGMDGHLAKPVDVKKLKTTLAKIYHS